MAVSEADLLSVYITRLYYQLSNADSWDNFEVNLNNFTVAALEKAKKHTNDYNINNNRPRPQPRPNNVPPRAINKRPQNFFDAREKIKIMI